MAYVHESMNCRHYGVRLSSEVTSRTVLNDFAERHKIEEVQSKVRAHFALRGEGAGLPAGRV